MRIGRDRDQQQQLRKQRRERAAELAKLGLTQRQISERLGVAASTVAELLAESEATGLPLARRRKTGNC